MITLEINYDYLASEKITLVSTGPKLQQQFEITINSKFMDTADFITCLIQLVLIVLGGFSCIFVTRFCKAEKADPYDTTGNREEEDLIVPAEIVAEGEQQPSDEEDEADSEGSADSFFAEKKPAEESNKPEVSISSH